MQLTPENSGVKGEVRLTAFERTRFQLWLCAELIDARRQEDDEQAEALRIVLDRLNILDDVEASHDRHQKGEE